MINLKIKHEYIAGVVVLYNSSDSVLNNIETYINQIAFLYVVDNSEIDNTRLAITLKNNNKIRYHSLEGNKGIATALNWAAHQAIEDGYRLLLTMDDDTSTPYNMINEMILFWNQYDNPIAILSGVHHSKPDTVPYRKLLHTLTSGNLLNLIAYQNAGPFRDDFFIDHVDHEYGLRLNRFGFEVIELPSIKLNHNLGYSEQIKLGKLILLKYGTHAPIRLYYFARNGLYISIKYLKTNPRFLLSYILEMAKRFFKALLLDKNRIGRLHMLFRGIYDGAIGKLGKHSNSI